jgi:hypothetical protein
MRGSHGSETEKPNGTKKGLDVKRARSVVGLREKGGSRLCARNELPRSMSGGGRGRPGEMRNATIAQ